MLLRLAVLPEALRREGRQIWALDLSKKPLDEVLSAWRSYKRQAITDITVPSL